MRRFISAVSIAAAALALAAPAASAAPAAHTAAQANPPIIDYMISNDNFTPRYFMHAHVFDGPIDLSATVSQTWDADFSCTTVVLLGQEVFSCMLRLHGTAANTYECVNYDSADNQFYLDGCDATDINELFITQTCQSSSCSKYSYGFVNIGASDFYGVYEYLDSYPNTGGTVVTAEPWCNCFDEVWLFGQNLFAGPEQPHVAS